MFVVAVTLCVLYSCFVAFSTLFAIFVNLLVMYFCNFYHLIRTKLEPVAVQSSAAAPKVKCNYTRLTVSVDESAVVAVEPWESNSNREARNTRFTFG